MLALVLTCSAPSRAISSSTRPAASLVRRLASIGDSFWSGGAVTAAAGCFDHEDVAWAHLRFVGSAQFDHRTVLAFNRISPERAIAASGHAIRGNDSMAGKDGRGHSPQ